MTKKLLSGILILMFRFIRRVTLLALLFALGTGFILWKARIPLLEHYLSNRFGAYITLQKVELEWNKLRLTGIKIENPLGKTIYQLFTGKTLSIEVTPLNLFRKNIQIDRVELHDSKLSLEFYNNLYTDSNWSRMLNGLPKSENDRSFIIKKLILSHLEFEVISCEGKSISIPPISYLEIENLGRKHSLTTSQIGGVIFQALLQQLSKESFLGRILDAVPYHILKETEDTIHTLVKKQGDEASAFFQSIFSGN